MFVIYLPVAKITVNIFYLIMIGIIGGFMPGVFGVGGGFLTVPLMIFLGIKPPIAIFSANTQIIYASFSSAVINLRKKNIDLQMVIVLSIGIFLGFFCGEKLINWIDSLGYLDIFIPVIYILFLGSVGSFMLSESISMIYKKYVKLPTIKKNDSIEKVLQKLPFQLYNANINGHYSVIIPLIGAFLGGILLTLGMSTGFVIYPVLIYILRMPISSIISTNMFAALFVILYLIGQGIFFDNRFDILLSFILIFSSIIGNVIGLKIAQKIEPEELRLGLSIVMIIIVLQLVITMIKTPKQLFSIV